MDLREADVQALPFGDATFDTVVATCVFCSMPDPVLGCASRAACWCLAATYCLEHVSSHRPHLRWFMQLANLVVARLVGANIDRDSRCALPSRRSRNIG